MYVTIVSNNPETLDALHSYLGRVGIPSHGTRAAHDFTTVAPECATATVIFPDDFDEAVVLRLVAELRRKRPRLLPLLVTRAPNRFQSVVSEDDRSLTPIVLARPSFGWDILDAIRDHSVKPQV
jgi:hypothetical protein